MNIRLDLIQPSPQPVRSSWDEAKMAELIESIRERGVIAPIKVRPTRKLKECKLHGLEYLSTDGIPIAEIIQEPCFWCIEYHGEVLEEIENEEWPPVFRPRFQPFEIVYGHRRFEASRRAGLVEIPTIIGELDSDDALIEQIIENELREDLPYLEKAQSYERAMAQKNWSANELAKRTGVPQPRISTALQWLAARRDGTAVEVIGTHNRSRTGQGEGVEATLEIKRALGDDIVGRRLIAAKVGREEIGQHDAHYVAEVYRDAEDEIGRQAILDTPLRDPDFDRLVKAKAQVRRDIARKQERKRQEETREVKIYLDALRTFHAAVQEATAVAKFGKFSPEAGRFVVRQHLLLRADLTALDTALEV